MALLAVAVVLPTVSLLWFMSRVIANERLVVRQKLTALYQDKLTDASAKTESIVRHPARQPRQDKSVGVIPIRFSGTSFWKTISKAWCCGAQTGRLFIREPRT